MQTVHGQPTYRDRARQLQAEMHQLDGATTAADLIEVTFDTYDQQTSSTVNQLIDEPYLA